MYRTTIAVMPNGCPRVAREYRPGEASVWEEVDAEKELDSSHARKLLACAKLTPLVFSTGLAYFISEES